MISSRSNKVAALAVWFVRRADDTRDRHLVDAARQYEAGRYDGVVVPANIAAEAALTPVVNGALRRHASEKNVDVFIRDVGYSGLMNAVVPMLADFYGVPRIPDVIRGALNHLRDLRNKVGHSGHCPPQSKAQAAEMLTAAIFGVRYADFLRAELEARRGCSAAGGLG